MDEFEAWPVDLERLADEWAAIRERQEAFEGQPERRLSEEDLDAWHGMIDTAFIERNSLKGFRRCPTCRVYHFKGTICTQKLLVQTKRLLARLQNPYKRKEPENLPTGTSAG